MKINYKDNNDYQWRKIVYLGTPSIKATRFLIKENISPAFYNNNNLGKILINNKDKIDSHDKNGVYELQCNDCPAIYIGQTGRNFKTRIKEHFNCWKKKKEDSLFANHLLETNHSFELNSYKVLHHQNKGKKLNTLEILEINKAMKENKFLLNSQVHFDSPLLCGF